MYGIFHVIKKIHFYVCEGHENLKTSTAKKGVAIMSETEIVKNKRCSGTHQGNAPIAFLDQSQLVQGRTFHHKNDLFTLNQEKVTNAKQMCSKMLEI